MIRPEDLKLVNFACKGLTNAFDVKQILKGFTRIAYEIYTLEETLKFGESADEPNGERIYRQVWQFPGWPTQPSLMAAGRDIQNIISLRPWLTKNDLAVRVWDLSNVPMQNIYQPHKETLDIEGQLIKRHIEQYGRAPIGNKVEQRRLEKGQAPVRYRPAVVGKVLHQIFDLD